MILSSANVLDLDGPPLALEPAKRSLPSRSPPCPEISSRFASPLVRALLLLKLFHESMCRGSIFGLRRRIAFRGAGTQETSQ